MKWVTNITLIFLAAGCMESIAPGEEALSGLTADKGYVGCKSATALSASEIQVEFDFPKDAVEISVHRDGFPVGSFTSPEVTNFVDENLTEGKKYKYSCVAKFDDGKTKKGSDVEETTIAVNPPVFNGITITIDMTNDNPINLRLFVLRSFGESLYHSITDSCLEDGYKSI